MNRQDQIRILLVDDHPLIRIGIRTLLEAIEGDPFTVVGETSTGAEAVELAISNLRYGTIGVNYWAATGFALVVTTWGAFPGHEIHNIQSGTGVVHNTLMFGRPEKSVLRAPFRSMPMPPWFATRGKTASKLFPKLVEFEASPSLWKVPGILWTAVVG